MHLQFNCSRKSKDRALILAASLVTIAAAAAPASSQSKERMDIFRKEKSALQAVTDEAVNSSAPGMGVLMPAKATYLDGYGVVVTVEAVLVPSRNPFVSPMKPEEVRKLVAERRTLLKQKILGLAKQQAAALNSVGPEQSLAIVVYLLNSNPADVPDLPNQMVFTTKKQNPADVTTYEF